MTLHRNQSHSAQGSAADARAGGAASFPLGALLAAAALAGAFAAGCAPLTPEPIAGEMGEPIVLAEVGDRVITDVDLERRVLERYYGPRALLGLVREALFLSEAERLGITVDDAELEARVEEEVRLVLGTTPDERRESLEMLRWQGLGVEDVRAELRAELGGMLLIQKVVAAHREVDEPALRELHGRSWEAPRRLLRHIAFPLRGDPADPEAVALVETRANQVRSAILSGASFAESARALSGNPETAARGGEIGWMSREELGDPALAEFVFGLEIGTLSPIYREGDYGFHLFQVVEARPAKPFEEVEEELRREILSAPPTDAEVLELESELRLRTPVRVRPQVGSPGSEERARG